MGGVYPRRWMAARRLPPPLGRGREAASSPTTPSLRPSRRERDGRRQCRIGVEEEGVYEAVRKVRRLHPRPSRQRVLPAKEVRVTRRGGGGGGPPSVSSLTKETRQMILSRTISSSTPRGTPPTRQKQAHIGGGGWDDVGISSPRSGTPAVDPLAAAAGGRGGGREVRMQVARIARTPATRYVRPWSMPHLKRGQRRRLPCLPPIRTAPSPNRSDWQSNSPTTRRTAKLAKRRRRRGWWWYRPAP